jgi:L-threonylcarbamoyladenylate synthase
MEVMTKCTQDFVKKAAKALISGHLVAFPTETVYGLGADATNKKAVSRIYSVKKRPTNHPLIVHISSITQLNNWTIEITDYALELAKKFWPGPMTLVLKRTPIAKDFITGGQTTVGIRVPCHPIALSLLKEFEMLGGLGVVAPSANIFGGVSPTSAESVNQAIGNSLSNHDFLLDGGSSSVGVESTIIDCTKNSPTILRPGAITKSMIQNCTGKIIQYPITKDLPKFSGSFASHYAPKAQVILDRAPLKGDGFIAPFEINTPIGVIRLASPKNSQEYARCLYDALREADNNNLSRVTAISPKGNEIEVAIRDRLGKASAERYQPLPK